MPTDWLMARTEATPEALALMFAGRSWSFGQLDSWVTKLALRLAAEGIPYLIDAFDRAPEPGQWIPRTNELPMDDAVVRFASPSR